VVQLAGDALDAIEGFGEWREHGELQDFTTCESMLQCTLAPEGVHIVASFDERVIERWLVEKT